MKRSTRVIALLMAAVTIWVTVAGLVGCSKKEEDTISKGEWLVLLCDEFGMESYMESEPYTNTVDEDSVYFPYVQMAYEWEIIDDKNIDLEEVVSKGFLAETLVKCVGLTDTSDMTDEEIVQYAVDKKYVSFKYRGRTDNIRNVTRQEAIDSAALAYNIWTDRTYETIEKLEVIDDVVDLTKVDMDASEIEVNATEETVKIPESAAQELEAGEVFILPQTDEYSTVTAYKVEKIEFEGGYAVIKTEEASFEEAIENLQFSGSVEPDLGEAPITDGLGNVIEPDSASALDSKGSDSNVALLGTASKNALEATPCAKGSFSFEVSGLKITGKASKNSISFSIGGKMQVGKSQNPKMEVAVEKSYEVKDISIDYDWDISWGKIKSAYAKLNYTTVDTTGASFSIEDEHVFDSEYVKGGTQKEWESWYNNEIKNLAKSKGSKTVTICSVPLVSSGLASINLEIKAKISFSGSVELEITTKNTYGLEYKSKSVRYIKNKSTDVDLVFKAQLEGTVYAGIMFKAVGFDLLGIGFEAGIGVEFKTIVHLVDSEMKKYSEVSVSGSGDMVELAAKKGVSLSVDGTEEELRQMMCGEVTTYFILKFKLDDECVLYDLIKKVSKGKFSAEIEFFGSDNGQIKALCAHVEDWKIVEDCTLEFGGELEEDDKDSTGTNDSTGDENSTGDDSNGNGTAGDGDSNGNGNSNGSYNDEFLDIDTYFLNLLVGNTETLSITELPAGYEKSAVKFTSSDPSIVTVDSNGKVKALKDGVAEITVSIPNTDYTVSCSIMVSSTQKDSFTGLDVGNI